VGLLLSGLEWVFIRFSGMGVNILRKHDTDDDDEDNSGGHSGKCDSGQSRIMHN